MASVKWTEDQHHAIYATDGTVLVSAAAGSGKTAVLVERVIQRILDEKNPCNVDELLIVTFTKSAAAQMKEKIGIALSNCIHENPGNRRLIRQQILLQNAKICTIDSFCNEVVRENFHAIDLEMNYRLLDDGEKKLLMKEAYDSVIEEFYTGNDSEFKELANMFVSGSDDRSLENVVSKLYEFSCAYAVPDVWLRSLYTDDMDCKIDKYNQKAAVIIDYLSDAMRYIIEMSDKAIAMLYEDEVGREKYLPLFLKENTDFKALYEAIHTFTDDQDWDKIFERLSTYTLDKLPSKPRGYESEILDYSKNIRGEYKKLIQSLSVKMCMNASQHYSETKRNSGLIKALSELTIAFSHRFYALKTSQNTADFSDIIHMALNLFVKFDLDGTKAEKTPLALEFSKQFKEILIDEYQDTNMAQDMLFSAISRDESNLFFVGDVKQSIYRFRQAMPKLFLQRRDSYKKYNDYTPEYPARIVLGRNFRSRKGIIDWINFLFSRIMSKTFGEIDYNEDEALFSGASYPELNGEDVELHYLMKSDDAKTKTEIEAVHIGNCIKEMIESQFCVTDGSESRPLMHKDICILLRSAAGRAGVYVETLEKMGISAYAQEKDNFFDAIEVNVMLSLLRVIDNPLQDIPLLTVMMSPIFGFNADDLSKIRLSNNGSLFACVVSASKNRHQKCLDFLAALSRFRLLSISMSPSNLIKTLLDETDYDDIVLAMNDGTARKENLLLLIKYAEDISANEVGLSAFIRKMDKFQQQGGGLACAPRSSGNRNAVTVMTIHHSKGLEYPVCFLANCSGKFNDASRKESLIIDGMAGAGLVGKNTERMYRYNTIVSTAVSLQNEFYELSEEMRVLYVAMTRAKEKLILVSTVDDLEKKVNALSKSILPSSKVSPFALRRMGSFSDWILAAALTHPDAMALRKYTGSTVCYDDDINAGKIKVVLADNEEEVQVEEAETTETLMNDAQLEESIKRAAEYKYPYKNLSFVMAKRGASDADKLSINKEFFASSRPAFMNEFGLTPAQKGTAMHLFMQFADYNKAHEDVRVEARRLTEIGFINSLQMQNLEYEKLNTFFESPLASRMFLSDKNFREKKFLLNMSACDFDENLDKTFADEKVLVQGIIDCAFVEDGQLVLIDYKTDKVKDGSVLADRYRSQLDIYRSAVRECLNMAVKEVILYSFHLGEEIIL